MLITRSFLNAKRITSQRPYFVPRILQRYTPRHNLAVLPIQTDLVRFYARRTARSTRVDEEVLERQQEQPHGQTAVQQRDPRSQLDPKGYEIEQQQTTEQVITPDTRKFLSKVYGTLMAGLGMAAVGSAVSFVVPALAIPGMIGSLIGVIVLVFMDKSKVVTRQNIFMAVTALTGMSIGPLIASYAAPVVFSAALGTSAIFGGFTLAALKSRRKSMLMLGGVLGGGLLMVFACGLAAWLLPLLGITNPALIGALFNINIYLGLGVFSLYVAYDTQRMIESYTQGDNDHVSPALSLFLDIINIFIRLLHIFGRK